jgi:hypothetical protein
MKRIFCVVPGFALTRVGARRPNSWKRGGKPHKVGRRNVIDRNSAATNAPAPAGGNARNARRA